MAGSGIKGGYLYHTYTRKSLSIGEEVEHFLDRLPRSCLTNARRIVFPLAKLVLIHYDFGNIAAYHKVEMITESLDVNGCATLPQYAKFTLSLVPENALAQPRPNSLPRLSMYSLTFSSLYFRSPRCF